MTVAMETAKARRRLCGLFVGSIALLAVGILVAAAAVDVQRAKATTEKLTAKNKSALIEVSSAVPDGERIEVVEVIQGLELSRDRIILFLDRIEKGVFPPEEGMKRATDIAQAEAQRQQEFLKGLVERVPPAVVPKVESALTISAESWEGIVAALQRSTPDEKRDVLRRPRTRIDFVPAPFPIPSQ